METSEGSSKVIEPRKTESSSKRGIIKGVTRVVTAGIVGGAMSLGSPTPVGAEGGGWDWIKDRVTDVGGAVSKTVFGPTATPTDLEKKQIAANAIATQVSAEATQVRKIKDIEDAAASVKATTAAVNFTSTPSPTASPTPTIRPTSTLSPDALGTQVGVEGTRAAGLATQADAAKRLTDARATTATALDAVNVASGAPSRTPTAGPDQATATAQAAAQATSDALRQSVQRTAIAENLPKTPTVGPTATVLAPGSGGAGGKGGPEVPGIVYPLAADLAAGLVWGAKKKAVNKQSFWKGMWKGMRLGKGWTLKKW